MRGTRQLGMHVTTSENNDYGAAFFTAKGAGIDFVNLHFIWGDSGSSLPVGALTTNADGTTFDNTLPDIANAFYPAYNTKVSLTIGTIDTNSTWVPSSLVSLPFDNQLVIDRFKALLDNLFSRIPNVELVGLQIGNEVDATLGADTTRWNQYATFFTAVAAHARTLRPGLAVGCTTTFGGITTQAVTTAAQGVHAAADFYSVTYYPMTGAFVQKDPAVVATDFSTLVATLTGKPIHVQEAGYSSGSTYVGGSEERQRQFVANVFTAWDQHEARVRMVSFLNLHEWSQAAVDGFGTQYGLCPGTYCDPFKEYLRTLGMRTSPGAGTNKPSFVQLRTEASARGWPVQ